jgi:hypothetical protein
MWYSVRQSAGQDLGFEKCVELLDGQQLVADAAAVGLDQGFSHGEPGSISSIVATD